MTARTTRRAEADAEQGADGLAQAGAQVDDRDEDVAQDAGYEVPGYEASAATCFKRAADIAKSLNHTNLTSDHLMLALTMDPNARRLLERVGDVTQFREAPMQRLGHYGSARNTSEQSSTPTSDLADVAKKAREAANEREQAVALSDLINAFPKLDGRLLYGSADSSKAIALMERIETGLVPRVARWTHPTAARTGTTSDSPVENKSVELARARLGARRLTRRARPSCA